MAIRIFERTVIQNFTFSSVAADQTGGGPLDFLDATEQNIHAGILRGVSVDCDSTDFDVSLRTKSNGQANRVSEVYSITGVNLYNSDDDLHQGWINEDSPIQSKLYMVLVNNDGANATGTVTIKIVSDIHKKFSKYT